MAAQPRVLAPKNDLETLGIAEETPDEHPLTTLRAMHDEAEETAELANRLGRTLYAVLLLPALVLAVVIFATPSVTRGLSFSVLVLTGAAALCCAYARAMRAPFDRAALRAHSGRVVAILLYTGFAWGAGAFLILPTNTDPAFTTFFSGGTAAIIAMIIRTREGVLMFAAPAGLLTALAALLRPLERPLIASALAVLACFFVAGSVALSSWMRERAAGGTEPTNIQRA